MIGFNMKSVLSSIAAAVVASLPVLASADDVQVGDPNTYYVNIEFSRDGRYAILFEGKPNPDGVATYTAWLSQVDTTTGDLVPSTGKGFSLGNAALAGLPQFGEDMTGPYAVWLDANFNLATARPNGSLAPKITVIRDGQPWDTRRKRIMPYAARNPNSALQYITYQLRNTSVIQQYLVELTQSPTAHQLVYEEQLVKYRQSGPVVSLSRWLPNSFSFVLGSYSSSCSGSPSQCPMQIKQITTYRGVINSSDITNDTHQKIDMFPFNAPDGSTHLVGGLDQSVEGGIYSFDDQQQLYTLSNIIPFHQEQSDLLEPGGAASFEPFIWRGDQYAVYHMLELGGGTGSTFASSAPSEIWVVKFGATPISCRVSLREYVGDPLNPAKRARTDPEPVVYASGQRAAMYYHSNVPAPQGQFGYSDLRKIDLGDKAAFDAACAAGTFVH